MKMQAFGRTIQNILRHPLGRRNKFSTITRYIRWQLGSRILAAEVAMPFVGNTRLLAKTGMHGATMNFYVGLQEFEDMAFLLHLLRPKDQFIDIGANVGVYSVLAAGVCRAQVVAIEPVPETFDNLMDNVYLNRLNDQVAAYNIGVARKGGELRFSSSLGPTNHVLTENDVDDAVTVPVKRLDDIALNNSPVLIKVDVEGFEQEVLRSGKGVFQNPSLIAVIMELNGLGKRYGYDDNNTDMMLRELGFVPSRYAPFKRELIEIPKPNSTGNTLYIRRSNEVNEKLIGSEPIEVHGALF